jgi:hypothetical protein
MTQQITDQEICSCCGTPINAADHAHKYTGYDGRTLETVFTHWCGAILGEATSDDICASIYIPQWDTGQNLPENQRYFDLTVLPPDGSPAWVRRMRSHGWFDNVSRKITQVG